jgi:hypothetical protein
MNTNEPIYGYNAQGEPITDPRDTILYRSHQLLRKQMGLPQEPPVPRPVARPVPRKITDSCANSRTNPSEKYRQLIAQFEEAAFQTEEVDQMVDVGQRIRVGQLPPAGLPLVRAPIRKPQTTFSPQVYNQGFVPYNS